MFDTRQALHTALDASGTWHGLYTSLHASDPILTTRAHEGGDVTGLRFEAYGDSSRRWRTTGTVIIAPDDGSLTVRADTILALRWFTALESLARVGAGGDETPPAGTGGPTWSWQPGHREQSVGLVGTLQLGAYITAETAIERATGNQPTYANSALALIPANRGACLHAWALGVAFLGVLASGSPAAPSSDQQTPHSANDTGTCYTAGTADEEDQGRQSPATT